MAKLNGLALKDHIREYHIFTQRLVIAAVITGLLVVTLVARMVYLQLINQDHFATLSENNRVNILPIPPIRGLIYDRNGILLAQNLPSFSLELIPEHIDDFDWTIEELRKLIPLTDEDVARYHKYRRKKRRFEGVTLRYRLTDEEVSRIAVNQYRLPGVEIRAELARQYPLGKLAVHAVGYVSRINEDELRKLDASDYAGTSFIGKVGVEQYYEDILHGTVGYQQVETNAAGRILNVLERTLPVPGKNLYLNLDMQLQSVAKKAFGDNNGALVALDPNNGAVLAFVSVPSFDPNLFANGLDSKTYKQLRDSPDRPLFNRALRGQYPPGSTIKPFIGLAGLELGVVNPAKPLNCPGWYTLKNDPRRYRDWKKQGHGETDLTKAIVQSCDVYFYDLSLNLGIDRMHQFLSNFGLGQRTGIDLNGEAAGLLPSSEWKRRARGTVWYPGETLIAGIGQGFMLATPLQLASITATMGEYGRRFRPQLLYAIQDADEKNHQVLKPQSNTPVPVVRKSDWQTVIEAMQSVISSPRGTAHRLSYNLPFTAAGKTGTAQVFGIKQDEEYDEKEVSKKLRDHALFIVFAPVEAPRIAIAVIVENGGHGGSVAGPIARKVLDAYLLKATPP
ncbi:MAG: penicillin-binding protein 2 [Proteobacteria bacterium]|jgi:penicillin-binding protein 2|nr:penicillin-binding protein 2 [Pseudomonadota bacterium]MCG6934788.1 penicillin-binding protein 2 [Pseudomonadota bacterium]